MSFKKISIYISVIIVCLLTIFPFLWIISTSFKPANEVYSFPPKLIPNNITLEGYKTLLETSSTFHFLKWTWNSFFVSFLTTIFSLFIATLGGYGMSRFRFKGRLAIGYIILLTQVLPGSLLVVPLYIIMNNLGLLNTHFGLMIAYTTFSVPFCTWMMKGFFDTIPKSIDQAALIDGCNKFTSFFYVVLPLAKSGLVATGIFSFITGWNEYLFASVFLKRYTMWTLPVGISSFQGQYTTDWNVLMAGSALIALPVVVIFWLLQKQLVSGMTAGSVKQ
ncbi:carbohydrate ABC transporter membrane protein 2 (CUT1 family) [Halanaerobium congolense]|uniref:Carbohydrate ABC transporter membrane protein 2 (CUT1 family) n=1 Tax=Halanaerobium congolense TaxID=54121 RepID=A0A4V3GW79_9FIRM|nr:carbohydrate ABC transporter permease [Halanaerobium congolense]TDX42949.1 carbohydrate ABC transporter membrane protein 2 (CUT1 family) [Halanaerobium congolense]